jgi:hypothetical protein
LSATAARLNTSFFADAGDDARAATRLTLGAGLGSDSQLFRFEPLWSHGVGVSGSLSLTRLDATDATDAEWLATGRATAALDRTTTPWAGQTFAGRILATAAAGEIETRSQLVEAGGADGLRGYAPGALFARSLGLMSGEWRHTFVHDLDWNLGHFNFARGFGGVLFADVGTISSCDSYRIGGAESWYASVGYGLHMLYDSFGTLPSIVRLDVAARLVDRQRECLGAIADSGPAVQLYLSFLPPF